MERMNRSFIIQILIFLIIQVAVQSDRCPELYKRYSAEHTYCKENNPQCEVLESFVSKEDINTIVKVHNDFRSKIATGKQSGLPTASNMLQMVWDPELAAVAQRHAHYCEFKHDCGNCRRVQNFDVGQNLYQKYTTYSKGPLKPDWTSAVTSWYNEVKDFERRFISAYGNSGKVTGHFTQVVWADTWRVGCGYATFKKGDTYYGLYTCNYGPAGNFQGKSMYKEGPTCSACPLNSCCDSTCGGRTEYPGLCKITDNNGPTYKPQGGSYSFYCDFHNQPDCSASVNGKNAWKIYRTLSGNYLGIVLNGGESSEMIFNNHIKPSTTKSCFTVEYRRGPSVAGQEDAAKAGETFTILKDNYSMDLELYGMGGDFNQMFTPFGMGLIWNTDIQYKLSFKVPPGKPQQFFEVKRLYAYEGPCH